MPSVSLPTTVISQVAVKPPASAVIVTLPALTALTTPLLSTVAIVTSQ
jgi:hypothetical protein